MPHSPAIERGFLFLFFDKRPTEIADSSGFFHKLFTPGWVG